MAADPPTEGVSGFGDLRVGCDGCMLECQFVSGQLSLKRQRMGFIIGGFRAVYMFLSGYPERIAIFY